MADTYATDSSERKYIPMVLASLAIAGAFVTFQLLKKLHIELSWWAGPPDTMACYALFYWIFDRFVWKWRVVQWVGLTRVPNLAGKWVGEVQPATSQGVSVGLGTPIAVTLTITQTWTNILVKAQTNQSRSHSLSGAVVVGDGESLSYEYVNEPSASAPATMHAHRGFVRLMLNSSHTVLEGEYYSGRDRQTIGGIRVTRS